MCTIEGLGGALDGLRIVQITDTHLGPFLSRRWAARITGQVNALDADVLAHTGDLVDGSLGARRHQVEPLGAATARDARVFITGNHEYYSGAREWTDYMCSLGWTVLRNRHVVVRRGTDALVVAGIDDRTAARSGVPGHGADLDAALAGAPAGAPVVLLAHQPRQVLGAVGRVDLQLSGPHPRRPALAVPVPGPAGPADACRALPARPADPALHQPRHRLLGPAVPDLRPTGDHRPDPAPGVA